MRRRLLRTGLAVAAAVLFSLPAGAQVVPPACGAGDATCSADSLADGLGSAYGIADLTGDIGTTSSQSTLVGSTYGNDSSFDGGAGGATSFSAVGDGSGSATGEASVDANPTGSTGSSSTVTPGASYGSTSTFQGSAGTASSQSEIQGPLGTASGAAGAEGGTGQASSLSTIVDGAYGNESTFQGATGNASSASRIEDPGGFAEGEATVAGAGPGSTSSISSSDGTSYRNDAAFQGPGSSWSSSGVQTGDGLLSSYIAVEGESGSTFSASGMEGGAPFTQTGAQADGSSAYAASEIVSGSDRAFSASNFNGTGGSNSSTSGIVDSALFSEANATIGVGSAWSLSGAESVLGEILGISAVNGTDGSTFSRSEVDATSLQSVTDATLGTGNAASLTALSTEAGHVVGEARADGSTIATSSEMSLDPGGIFNLNTASFSGSTGIALAEGRAGSPEGHVAGMAWIEATGDHASSHFAELDVWVPLGEGVIDAAIDSVIEVAPGSAQTYSSIGIGGVTAIVEAAPGGAASALAVLNQTLSANLVHDAGDSRQALIEASVQDSHGIISINQDSGNVNNQANVRSLALVSGPAVQIQGIDARVETSGNTLTGASGPREDRITDSFGGSVGIVGVNQSAGNLNQQANVLSLAIALGPNLVPIADSSLGTVRTGNTKSEEEPIGPRRDVIDGTSFHDFLGIAQIAQSAGSLNIINNRLAVSIGSLGGAP